MASIKNNTRRAITLPSMHVIPAMGILDGITNDVINMRDNALMIGGLARSLQIEVSFDAEVIPDEGPVTASIEPNPEAVEQAKVNAALEIAAAKEKADQEAAAAQASPKADAVAAESSKTTGKK